MEEPLKVKAKRYKKTIFKDKTKQNFQKKCGTKKVPKIILIPLS